MNILNKLKRFYYKWKNNDPLYKCKLHKEKGCVHVDGPLCDHPNCSIAIEYLGDNWVSCVDCKFQDLCSSKQFGLGCYNGEKYEKL